LFVSFADQVKGAADEINGAGSSERARLANEVGSIIPPPHQIEAIKKDYQKES